jgi:hypothetical protein
MTDKAVIEDQNIEELDVAPENLEAEDGTNEGENKAAPDDAEEEELIVTIGEEAPPQQDEDTKAPEWLRNVRKQNREQAKEIRVLKQQLAQVQPREQTPQLGPKPTLESCDYDADLFERKLDAWKERKIVSDRQAAEAKDAEAKRQEYFNSKFEAYSTRKAEVIGKIKDFADVEETVLDALNDTQRGVVLAHAKDPALLLYAIGKDEKRLQELAKLSDPVEFIFAVARMETQMRTQSRKPASGPETRITGSAPSPGSETQLNKLREAAEKTGDYTKVIAYKNQLKSKRGT